MKVPCENVELIFPFLMIGGSRFLFSKMKYCMLVLSKLQHPYWNKKATNDHDRQYFVVIPTTNH